MVFLAFVVIAFALLDVRSVASFIWVKQRSQAELDRVPPLLLLVMALFNTNKTGAQYVVMLSHRVLALLASAALAGWVLFEQRGRF